MTEPSPDISSAPTSADREERFVLAIDLGTGGPKVGLVSLTGKVAWHDHCPVETRLLPGGGAVQDAAVWWDLIVDATRRAMASGVVEPHQVEAVSCTGQWSSTVPVDERGSRSATAASGWTAGARRTRSGSSAGR